MRLQIFRRAFNPDPKSDRFTKLERGEGHLEVGEGDNSGQRGRVHFDEEAEWSTLRIENQRDTSMTHEWRVARSSEPYGIEWRRDVARSLELGILLRNVKPYDTINYKDIAVNNRIQSCGCYHLCMLPRQAEQTTNFRHCSWNKQSNKYNCPQIRLLWSHQISEV